MLWLAGPLWFSRSPAVISSWWWWTTSVTAACLSQSPWTPSKSCIMNLWSAKDWRCKRTGGAQTPATLFTQRKTQWSVGELWILPSLLLRHCSAYLWRCSPGDQSWPCLSTENFTWVGLARHAKESQWCHRKKTKKQKTLPPHIKLCPISTHHLQSP